MKKPSGNAQPNAAIRQPTLKPALSKQPSKNKDRKPSSMSSKLEKTPAFKSASSPGKKQGSPTLKKSPPRGGAAAHEDTMAKVQKPVESNDYYLDEQGRAVPNQTSSKEIVRSSHDLGGRPGGPNFISSATSNNPMNFESQASKTDQNFNFNQGNASGLQNHELGDGQSLMNQSIGGQTRLGDPTIDNRSNYGATIDKAHMKKSKVPDDYNPLDPVKEEKQPKSSKVKDELVIKSLPQPVDDESIALKGKMSQFAPRPGSQKNLPVRNRGCCKCLRKNRASPESEQLVEYIETNLDSLGKHFFVGAFSLQQLSSIYIACLLFYNFFNKECNPVVYQMSDPMGFHFDQVMLVCMATAIVAKFASIVFFALALDEYQNLSSNTSYFVASLLTCAAPTCLVAPAYTYDHMLCQPKNFSMFQENAELLATASLFLIMIPIALIILTPTSWNRVCCHRCRSKKIKNFQRGAAHEQQEPLLSEKMSSVVVYFNYVVCSIITIMFALGTLAVLIPQNMLLAGDFFKLGTNNEIYSVVFLVVIFILYHQHEVTEEEIKEKLALLEDAIARKQNEDQEDFRQMSLKTNAQTANDSSSRKKSVGQSDLISQDQPQNQGANPNLSQALESSNSQVHQKFVTESELEEPKQKPRAGTVAQPKSQPLGP